MASRKIKSRLRPRMRGYGSIGSGEPTSNLELEAKLKRWPHFVGAVSIDHLPVSPKTDMSLIVNFERSTQPGTHWVAIYFTDEYGIYLDPFGMPPPAAIQTFMCKYNKPMVYNNIQYQEIRSARCGLYCFYFIDQLARGVPIYSVLYKLDMEPTDANEKFVQKYWESHST